MGCLDLCISDWNDPVEKVFLVALLLVVVVVVIFPWFLIHICCDDLFLSRFVQFLEEGDTSLISLVCCIGNPMMMDLDFMGIDLSQIA